jgi:hypothetical protein
MWASGICSFHIYGYKTEVEIYASEFRLVTMWRRKQYNKKFLCIDNFKNIGACRKYIV